jgi:hypothetical protein
MSVDITSLLRDWDFVPGQVLARRFQGRDGREKVQLRVDLGVLQMNAEGRPDGKRPMGQESWFEVLKARLEKSRAASKGEDPDFELSADDCSKLQQEAIQYHHRYICLFQLDDFDGVLRDADRNLEVFAFVDAFAASEELAWSLNQFAPQLLMMRTRALGTRAKNAHRHAEAERHILEGIEALETFYREHEREDLLENSGELNSLRSWLTDVRVKRPKSELEKLQQALAEAIRIEDYEKAARVRDALRKLQSSKS